MPTKEPSGYSRRHSKTLHRADNTRKNVKEMKPTERLKEVALLFLRLGAFSFGGPAVYIALMHDEVVRRRRWIDEQRFLDLVGATNLVPGPNATEIAIYLGLIRAGWPGLIASGALFILPGMVATLLVAWAYVTYGSIPEVGWVLYGVKPVVIGIVIQALWNLGRTGIKGLTTAIVGIGVVALYLLGLNEIALLFGGAAVVLLVRSGFRFFRHGLPAILVAPALFLKLPLAWFTASAAGVVVFSQSTLFLTFLKIGAVLYGSGYVLLAFLRSEFVVNLGWLTDQQVLDAIVAGQITPGPVFSSATFVGYLVGGWPSALLATLGIFLPSFLFVGLLSRILPLVRKSWWAATFLDGVNAASLGLMFGVTWQLGQAALVDIFTVVLSLVTLLLIFRFKVNSVWLILGGGLLGAAYKLVLG
ncbi:MAG: chromate transporter, chromate ion transporter family [Dehalococcoidales bacterium]|nr:chromate transporter, chromate ion transporter family [Dehalococcoidales bacterium]